MAIQLEDVRAALGADDPFKTSAPQLRERLGSGSLSTIQKHLAALRAEAARAAAVPTENIAGQLEAPRDLLDALWRYAAEGAARAVVQALSRAQGEAEAQRREATALATDLAGFQADNEDLEQQLAGVRAERDQVQAQLAQATGNAAAVQAEHAGEVARMQQEHREALTAAQHRQHDLEVELRVLKEQLQAQAASAAAREVDLRTAQSQLSELLKHLPTTSEKK